MSRLRFRVCMSLDGFVAGPEQSVNNPMGAGGMRLADWAFELQAFRDHLGLEGKGEVNESTRVFEQALTNVGATIMGRNMFGGHPGPWSKDEPWDGWWGEEPPFRHPVFVLTHHARSPLQMKGGTTFYFVTDGIGVALEQARQAAGGKDVSLGGGANAARQYLAAGLVDEMLIHLVPFTLGAGERLFEGIKDIRHGLEHIRTIAAPGVVHLMFTKQQPGANSDG